ncbi:GGDEF domain-containing protein [Oceanobacter mangrovi]|uniref:GGDEF domain-containing protein n=1 Tax=Oceanobacter mangrovi TaxID=2862510 RepID=UPI001C8F0869|nr:GGDEF domain-containing protein [Oceanobacter mangrovi]
MNSLREEFSRPRQELVSSIYSQLPIVAIGNTFLVVGNLLAYHEKIDPAVLWSYGMAAILLPLIRVLLFLNYRHHGFQHRSLRHHSHILQLISLVNGLVWGAWGGYVVVNVPAAEVGVMVILQAGHCAGAASTSSASRIGLVSFLIPALGPLIYFEAITGTRDGLILASGFLVYTILAISSSQRIYRTLYDSILLAEKNRQLADQLYRYSHTDSLTGIANRRSFNSRYDELWQQLESTQQAFSLLLCDVDFFKSYNDSKGHMLGDECLRSIAIAMREYFAGTNAMVARYGGEEFIALLPGVGEARARELAEGLRQKIHDAGMPHELSIPWQRVTISVGLASHVAGDGISQNELIERADKALYQAKGKGRNRVCALPSENPMPDAGSAAVAGTS